MYMSLYWEHKLICEVNVYAEKNPFREDDWHIEIRTYFDVKNLLDLYENDYIGYSYFREDMGNIQKYRLNYNEGCDRDLPKPQSYKNDTKLGEDKNRIIEVIRNRLQRFAKSYNLAYKED